MRAKRTSRTMALTAATAALLFLGGAACKRAPKHADGTGQERTRAAEPVIGATGARAAAEAATPAILFGSVAVNGLRVATLTPDIPLIVTAAFATSEGGTKGAAGDPARAALSVTGADGKPVAVEAKALPAGSGPDGSPAAGLLRWILKTPPPAGEYIVSVSVPADWVDKARLGVGALRIEPASLRMTDGAAPAGQKAYWERRTRLARGDYADYLKAVDAALAASPGDGNLKLERVEGLALSGDRATAAKELAILLAAMEQAQRKARPDKEPHIPAWLLDYLGALEKK